MSEERKHNRQYTLTDIEQYLLGKLSPAEMHELEKAAVQDPFLADAIEGYQSSDLLRAKEDLTKIQTRLLQEELEEPKTIPIASQKSNWWKIAAVIILLAGIGTLGWKFLISPNTKQELAKQPVRQIQKDSASSALAKVIKKDTPVQKADLVADVVPKPKEQPLKKNIPVTVMAEYVRPVTAPRKYLLKDTTLLAKNAQPYTYDNSSRLLAGKVPGISAQEENKMLAVKPERDLTSTTVTDLYRKKELADQSSGAPIRIRGNSSADTTSHPIYIIDGIKMKSVPDINASNIKSITVLKKEDAIAQYGSEGENGAVVVTSNNHDSLSSLTVTGSIASGTFSSVLSPRAQANITPLASLNNSSATNRSALTVSGNTGMKSRGRNAKPLYLFNGKIIDEKTASPIPNASIVLTGTKRGLVTDANGNFSFESNDTLQKISVSSLAFEQKDVLAKAAQPNEIKLKESTAALNEIVVVGYGTQKKKDVTGSVTKISPQPNETIPEGGWDSFRDYLKKKINTLDKKEQREVQHGPVTVELTLKNGRVRNVMIMQTFNNSLNKTLIQAIKHGPHWTSSITPGKKEKRTVNFVL